MYVSFWTWLYILNAELISQQAGEAFSFDWGRKQFYNSFDPFNLTFY